MAFRMVPRVDTRKLEQSISDTMGRMTDLSGAWDVVGEVVLGAVEDRFQAQGEPTGWPGLKDGTKEGRRVGSAAARAAGKGPQMLQDTGRLKSSITAEKGSGYYEERSSDELVIGTNVVYAAIHNFGGQAGRNRATTIPQREFTNMLPEDVDEIAATIDDYIKQGWK